MTVVIGMTVGARCRSVTITARGVSGGTAAVAWIGGRGNLPGMDGSDLVRVFDLDPDLLEGVEEPSASHLRMRMVARRIWVAPGMWDPEPAMADPKRHLGLLVLDGLLIRSVRLAGREACEVLGPGDLLRPWAADGYHSVRCESQWRVLQPATLASLDERLAGQIARWPAITAALLSRATRRSRSLVYQATIAHVRHAETRVLLALWQLADRWGRVTPRGVVVPVPLTHQLLADLTCLQRPTVSAAIGDLVRAGELSRLPDGGWLVHGEPPMALAEADDARSAWMTSA